MLFDAEDCFLYVYKLLPFFFSFILLLEHRVEFTAVVARYMLRVEYVPNPFEYLGSRRRVFFLLRKINTFKVI
jgi:hypothetical protein